MSWYRTRIERDLTRWQSSGWVSDAGAAAIRAELASRKSPIGVAGVLAILGAVLFGFAAMSFVAANWNEMSKLARLLLLVVALWACYGGAAYLFARRLALFANAAVLAGIAVFGASIMLIAQMYHMEGNPPDAVLVWALGALLARSCFAPMRRWRPPSCCWRSGRGWSAASTTPRSGCSSFRGP